MPLDEKMSLPVPVHLPLLLSLSLPLPLPFWLSFRAQRGTCFLPFSPVRAQRPDSNANHAFPVLRHMLSDHNERKTGGSRFLATLGMTTRKATAATKATATAKARLHKEHAHG
jgi:hypothetical protein